VIQMEAKAVKELLSNLGVYPDRKRGQTFLVDEHVAEREAIAANISPEERVLEIGPGLGMLTSFLLKYSRNVVAIESDRRLAKYLREVFSNRLQLLQGDALEMEIPSFDLAVGNLPYSTATPMIFRLSSLRMKRGLFMIQKEVARRIVEPPGTSEYSRISVMLQRLYNTKYLFEVGHSHFYPQPEVDSAVIMMERREGVEESVAFNELVSILFSHRRKTIRAALKQEGLTADVPYAQHRAEELGIKEMEELASLVFGPGESGERSAESFRRERCR